MPYNTERRGGPLGRADLGVGRSAKRPRLEQNNFIYSPDVAPSEGSRSAESRDP